MVGKDQAIGGVIFLACVLVAVFYVVTLFYPQWLSVFGVSTATEEELFRLRLWATAVPVFIAFVAVMGIGAWIGWTMATTPPPKPIEELTVETEKEEEAPSEEKKPERKGKGEK